MALPFSLPTSLSTLSPEQNTTVRRVLIYRLGSLGDTLIALPALHLIAAAFPNAERRLLTNHPVHAKAPAAAAILEHTGLVHGYLRYQVGTRSPLDLLRLWASVVHFRPQVLVYLGSSRGVASALRDARFFRACGLRRQIGVPHTEAMDQPQRDQPHAKPSPPEESASGQESSVVQQGETVIGAPGWPAPPLPYTLELEAARLVRNLAEIGSLDLNDPAAWDLHLTPEEHAAAAEVLAPAGDRPILAVSVGTKVQAKDWGRENWRALLTRLAQLLPDHALALAGVPAESEASDFAAAGWRTHSSGPVLNLCGRLTPRASAAAFSRARLFLGHDSGPMHLAAAVGTPCVAIFAARNIPRVWFPHGQRHRVLYHRTDCWGCGLETCTVERKRCLTSISVDEVFAAVQASLTGSRLVPVAPADRSPA